MTSRPAQLSGAPDPRGWLHRRKRGDAVIEAPERTELALVDLEAAGPALCALELETPRLSLEDEVRLARVADEAARSQRRAAHIALRIMLERFAGEAIRRMPYRFGPHGKPFLDAVASSSNAAEAPDRERSETRGLLLPPHFSLSHTRSRALIAVSTLGPIGVDIEHHRSPRIMGERRSAIEHAGEALAGGVPLPDGDRDLRFLTAWVRLEAVAKADGAGLGAHLSIILGRRSQRSSGAGAEGVGNPRDVVARDVPMASGFYAALAGPASMNIPECLIFPASRAEIAATLQENA